MEVDNRVTVHCLEVEETSNNRKLFTLRELQQILRNLGYEDELTYEKYDEKDECLSEQFDEGQFLDQLDECHEIWFDACEDLEDEEFCETSENYKSDSSHTRGEI
ncbi:uncharacterized protein LOC111614010 [Centruroides sculpturatus]|uniref:uncharacterized protein LOC111614010 n=1 Tax=Centruroides sculpturatus TaxID=218467 RepID=UPI000C6DD3CA|nr:uncharacterized protein LOC111614010 [Centruroides sculpturatus]